MVVDETTPRRFDLLRHGFSQTLNKERKEQRCLMHHRKNTILDYSHALLATCVMMVMGGLAVEWLPGF